MDSYKNSRDKILKINKKLKLFHRTGKSHVALIINPILSTTRLIIHVGHIIHIVKKLVMSMYLFLHLIFFSWVIVQRNKENNEFILIFLVELLWDSIRDIIIAIHAGWCLSPAGQYFFSLILDSYQYQLAPSWPARVHLLSEKIPNHEKSEQKNIQKKLRKEIWMVVQRFENHPYELILIKNLKLQKIPLFNIFTYFSPWIFWNYRKVTLPHWTTKENHSLGNCYFVPEGM